MGLDESILSRIFGVGCRPCHHVRRSKCHLRVPLDELLVGGRVPALRACYQDLFDVVEWSAHHFSGTQYVYTAWLEMVPLRCLRKPAHRVVAAFHAAGFVMVADVEPNVLEIDATIGGHNVFQSADGC